MSDEPIRLLVVEDNAADARLLRECLEEADGLRFELTHVDRLSRALEMLRSEPFDAIILDLKLPDSVGLATFARTHSQSPEVPILVLTGSLDESVAMDAVAGGAHDYLVKGRVDGESLARSIRYAIARHRSRTELMQKSERGVRGRVLGFMGAKGGVGTTTLVLNQAAILGEQGKAVVAVELRANYGSFAAQLGRACVENISHLSKFDPDEIDQERLHDRLVHLPSGARALYGPQEIDEFGEIGPERVAAVLEGLANMADNTLVDMCCYPSDTVKEGARHCDFITVVTGPDPACIASGKMVVDMLKGWDIGGERIGAAIVNIVPMFASLAIREIQSELGCEVVGTVPSASDDILAAFRHGQMLVTFRPAGAPTVMMTEMINRLVGDVPDATIS